MVSKVRNGVLVLARTSSGRQASTTRPSRRFSIRPAGCSRIFDTAFFFASAVPIGSFSIDFGSDAMLGLRFNVPERGSLGMLLLGLLCVLMLSKRRRCA